MPFQVSTKDSITPALRRMTDVAKRPLAGVRGPLVRRSFVKILEQSLGRGGYFNAAGQFVSYTPTKAFGTKPATLPPLGGPRSSIMNAVRGGAGGSWVFARDRARLIVDLVYADVHHEGASIGVTPKMRGFVRGTFGVHLRADKRTIEIPRRPLWDARAPQFAEAARDVILEALLEAAE